MLLIPEGEKRESKEKEKKKIADIAVATPLERMQLCLNQLDFSGDGETTNVTEDARVNAALELSPEERSFELSVALLRQFVGRRVPQDDPLVQQVDVAFPRGPNSIGSKSVVAALLGFELQKSEALAETLARTMLRDYAMNPQVPEDPKVTQVRCLPIDHQIYELTIALLRQFAVIESRKNPNAVHLPAWLEQRFPKTANNIGKSSTLTTLTQLNESCGGGVVASSPGGDGPPCGYSTLQQYILNNLVYREQAGETIEKQATQNFDYQDDGVSVEINGFRVGDTNPTAYVKSLDDLDFANAVVLGRGAGGSVMKVRHPASGYTFAVKEILLSEESIEQVKNEVQVVWGSVRAPIEERCASICDCFGVFYRAVTLYIVMELMDGSLKDLEKKRRAVDETGCCAIAFQALQGLAFLHDRRRQLHRDIKPHNVLYRVSDGLIKIADFGISSKPLETIKNFKQDTYCGTVLYMSPQRAAGEPYGYEGDMWSLGVTLLELAMGALPFQANIYAIDQLRHNPPRLPPTSPFGAPFSPEFQDFIAQCCRPVVGPDYPTAAKLLQHPFLMYMSWDDSRRIAQSFPS